MPWTTKLLVVASRTVDSDEVHDAILARAGAAPLEVTIVAPASGGSGSVSERREQTAERLERALRRLRAAGVSVEGVVGDSDPICAVQDVWDPRRFDEVLVATLPPGVSRWMAVDLPRRIGRLTGATISRVIASERRAAAI